MSNRHIRDLRMLAGLNGVRSDDRRILENAAQTIDTLLANLQVIVAVEGKRSWAGNKAQQAIEEAAR